jgi:predicted negative regulator of RcsB-dependent stress response
LTNLGDAYQAAGDTPAARNAWQQALDILTDPDHLHAAKARTRLSDGTGPRGSAAGA